MFVGRTGVERVVQRTCEVLNEQGIDDPTDIGAARKFGVVDLPTMQKKINFHVAVTLDLFGAEISTNAANAFNASLKGRFRENRIDDDHQLANETYPVEQVVDGRVQVRDVPALSSINARLSDDFIADCNNVLKRWNWALKAHDIDFRLSLPHRAFNRAVGEFAEVHATPQGEIISETQWAERHGEWLPSEADMGYILSLMEPCREPGKFAGWIAPPRAGINGMPGDFEYVKLAA